MRFWDSSALMPLLVPEPTTADLMALMRSDPAAAVWWATPIECASAIARLARDERLSRDDTAMATGLLEAAQPGWSVIPPTDRVRQQAMRLLRLHPLRAADALQLAAALVLAEHDPRTLPFVTLDDRLALAAEREGFAVMGADLSTG
ncbi:MAG: type II toxin-antitoxin system VapC family toxin [Gemmatimonadales bacterium]|nr:type II toxin-antitoxin system VapC family toxin [Gemmatimonadales bacterium]MDZ4390464.1 type II toxin-antitoxin system VapC family toxin [Gemmatimonadales bacterium]